MTDTILDHAGNVCYLSDEIYEVVSYVDIFRLPKSTKVRKISGIDGSKTPGYHFTDGYVTVCPVDVSVAEFLGFRVDELKLVGE